MIVVCVPGTLNHDRFRPRWAVPRYREFVWAGPCEKAAKDAKQTTLISTRSSLEETVVVGDGTKVPSQYDGSNFRVTSIPRSRRFFSFGSRQLHGRQKIGRCSFPEKISGKVDASFPSSPNSLYYFLVDSFDLSFTILFSKYFAKYI